MGREVLCKGCGKKQCSYCAWQATEPLQSVRVAWDDAETSTKQVCCLSESKEIVGLLWRQCSCSLTMMTGWEVYAPGWGGVAETDSNWFWQSMERHYAILDCIFLNRVSIDGCHPDYAGFVIFIRQPEDKDSVAMRLRVQNCTNIIKRQWLQAMYNPARLLCRRQLLQVFHALAQ